MSDHERRTLTLTGDNPAAYARPARGEALHAAVTITGVMRMLVTELEMATADIDDDIASQAVNAVRRDVDRLGVVLVHRRSE